MSAQCHAWRSTVRNVHNSKSCDPCFKVCETCGKSFRSKQAFSSHKLTHKKYTCDKCGVGFVGQKRLKDHLFRKHASGSCHICGKVYVSEKMERTHILRVHTADKDKPYQCPDCDRGFIFPSELSVHQMQAHIKERPYECQYNCGQAYNDKGSRGTHETKKHGRAFIVQHRTNEKSACPFKQST